MRKSVLSLAHWYVIIQAYYTDKPEDLHNNCGGFISSLFNIAFFRASCGILPYASCCTSKVWFAYIPRKCEKGTEDLDPAGVEERRSHRILRRTYRSDGPNSVWHMDRYDKLKPYGFAFHGCIDGFSLRLIWLECANTNNDPVVIAGYYVRVERKLGYWPRNLRSDCGTETASVTGIQCVLAGSNEAYISTGHLHQTKEWRVFGLA